MKALVTDVRPYKVQCFDDRGNSRDFPPVHTMAEIEKMIAESLPEFPNAVIYRVDEVRMKVKITS